MLKIKICFDSFRKILRFEFSERIIILLNLIIENTISSRLSIWESEVTMTVFTEILNEII